MLGAGPIIGPQQLFIRQVDAGSSQKLYEVSVIIPILQNRQVCSCLEVMSGTYLRGARQRVATDRWQLWDAQLTLSFACADDAKLHMPSTVVRVLGSGGERLLWAGLHGDAGGEAGFRVLGWSCKAMVLSAPQQGILSVSLL